MYLELQGTDELYVRLLRALRHAILQGRILPGAKMPSTRVLAQEHGLSRNTVLAAYEQLCAEHLAVTRVGSGTFVNERLPMPTRPRATTVLAPASRYAARLREQSATITTQRISGVRYDLQYGEPLVDLPLFSTWRRSLLHAAMRTDARYPSPHGLLELRREVAAYLGRRRGIECVADDIVVVNGTQQAVTLIARLLLDEGDTAVLEDPHYGLVAQCLRAHGAAVKYIAVGADGLDARLVVGSGVRLVFVTPSHQFPSGVAMSLPKRLALLEAASERKFWIVEDDYDGEYGLEGRLLPALRSLDADDRVVYVGSFSKTMFPTLRLGYVVCPQALRADLVHAKRLADIASSGIEQAAMAHFMASGGFDRHLRKAALELRRRRKALLEGVADHCGARVQIRESGAGMHCVGWLPKLSADNLRALIELAASHSLGLHPIAPHYARPPTMQGLLLGFAALSVPQLRVATRILGQCLDQLNVLVSKVKLPRDTVEQH